jgi:ribonuclease R
VSLDDRRINLTLGEETGQDRYSRRRAQKSVNEASSVRDQLRAGAIPDKGKGKGRAKPDGKSSGKPSGKPTKKSKASKKSASKTKSKASAAKKRPGKNARKRAKS